jgi:PTH1 family peptidyl-tRNA hydrolase
VSDAIQLIVGLGNPGAQYAGTRHNAGADFVAELARQAGAILKKDSKYHGEVAECLFSGHKLRLLVPDDVHEPQRQGSGGARQLLQDDA